MDPITAWALAAKAIAEMVTEIVKGQPADVKEKIWREYQADVDWWRKFLHLPNADQ